MVPICKKRSFDYPSSFYYKLSFSSSAQIMNTKPPECSGCQHENKCEDVYRCLGESDAPPIAGKIVLAFIVPMLLFVLALAASDHLLSSVVHARLSPIIGVIFATSLTLLYAVTVRRCLRRPGK
jgi:hypothetical protein